MGIIIYWFVLSMLLIFVVISERRWRSIIQDARYITQTVLPSTHLLLPSEEHTLFQIPDTTKLERARISLYGSVATATDTTVRGELHGATEHPIELFECAARDTSVLVNTDVDFLVGSHNRGERLYIRIHTIGHGSKTYMSDMVVMMELF